MSSDQYTLIQLLDISLGVPRQPGVIDFNTLHTALKHLVIALGLQRLQPDIGNAPPSMVTRGRSKKKQSVTSASSLTDAIKNLIEKVQIHKSEPTVSTQKSVDDEKKESQVFPKEEPEEDPGTSDGKNDTEKRDEVDVSETKSDDSGTSDGKDTAEKSEGEGSETKSEDSETSDGKDTAEKSEEEGSETKSEYSGTSDGKDTTEKREEEKDAETKSEDSGTSDGKNNTEKRDEVDVSETKSEDPGTSDGSPKDVKVKAEPKSEEFIQQGASKSANAIQEKCRSAILEKRVGAVEGELHELTTKIDQILDYIRGVETNSADRSEKLETDLRSFGERTQKLEGEFTNITKSIEDSQEQTEIELERLELSCNDEFEKIKEELSTNVSEINEKVQEVKGLITPREDFTELVSRVDKLEEVKVNREELGQFMEEGFIENFVKEHETLKVDLDALRNEATEVNNDIMALEKRMDEEVVPYIDDSLDKVKTTMEAMRNKLDTLDADDINDTFAKLEDQATELIKDMESLQYAENRIEKEARVNFKKISDLSDAQKKLENSKIDKSKIYDLLELKADLESMSNKLDTSEFVSVVQDIEEKVKTLTSKVEVTEKNLDGGLRSTREALSYKMYTEDFVVATEPMKNRIKAIMYEQEKLKELVRQTYLPDAPGVVKCFSCKRGANLTDGSNLSKKFKSPNLPESKNGATEDKNPSIRFPPINVDRTRQVQAKSSTQPESTNGANQNKSEMLKLPSIDISVPIPPANIPRTKDLHKLPGHKLPVLLEKARPQIGLKYQKRRQDIDRELSEYFEGGKDKKSIVGAHQRSLPQQRGHKFSSKTIEVLIEGTDKRIYNGAINKDSLKDMLANHEENEILDESGSSSEEQSNIIYPTDVVLHRKGVPVPSKKYVPRSLLKKGT